MYISTGKFTCQLPDDTDTIRLSFAEIEISCVGCLLRIGLIKGQLVRLIGLGPLLCYPALVPYLRDQSLLAGLYQELLFISC